MKHLLLHLACLNCLYLCAQQAETFTQFQFNYFALNPAYAGTKESGEFVLGRRQQWIGFEGAPVSNFVSFNTSSHKGRGSNSWRTMGGYFYSESFGPYSFSGLYGSYGYQFQVSKDYMLSVAMSVGIRHYVFSTATLLGNGSAGDPAFNQTQNVYMLPDISPGLWLYSSSFFTGLSVKHAAPIAFRFGILDKGYEMKTLPTFYYTLGKKFESKKYAYTYVPSMLLKFSPFSPPTIDFNFLYYIKNQLGVGMSVKTTATLSAMVQYQVKKKINFGYSYDYALSKYNASFRSSHELIMSYTLGPESIVAPALINR